MFMEQRSAKDARDDWFHWPRYHGQPMAYNLMKAGYELVISNRNPVPANELAAEGATTVGSPQAVAELSDVVITMLPDSPHVRAVVTGEDGGLAGAQAGPLLLDMGTTPPHITPER